MERAERKPRAFGLRWTVGHPVGLIMLQHLGIKPKEAHRSESKPESDFSGADLRVRSGRGPGSPSPRKSPICFGPESPSPRGGPICFGHRESESKGESDLFWTPESESKGESDWLWTGESESKPEPDLARHLLRLDLLGRALFGPLRKRALF